MVFKKLGQILSAVGDGQFWGIPSSYRTTSNWWDFQNNDYLLLIIIARLMMDFWKIWLVSRQLSFMKRTRNLPNELVGWIADKRYQEMRVDSMASSISQMYALSVLLIIKTLKILFNYHPFVWELTSYYADSPFCRATLYAAFDTVISKFAFLPFATFGMMFSLTSNTFVLLTFVGSLLQIFINAVISGTFMMLLIKFTDLFGPGLLIYGPLATNMIAAALIVWYIQTIPHELDNITTSTRGELNRSLTGLANRVGYPAEKIYVDPGFQKPQAYFMGLLGANMVVVTVPLIKMLNYLQVTAVVAHELGHWTYRHTSVGLLFALAEMISNSYLMSCAYDSAVINEIFRFQDKPQAMVPVYLWTSYGSLFLDDFASGFRSISSHKQEFDADNFAVIHGLGEALKSSLLALQKTSGSTPVHDRWYSLWFRSHPDTAIRVQRINDAE